MKVIFAKGTGKYGLLTCVRDDGTVTETKMPEQGIIPHDMIHFVVEKALSFSGAFYGQLKAGAGIDFKLEHNISSQEVADDVESLQTESLVESLQAVLWYGSPSYDDFIYLVQQACSIRHVPLPVVTADVFNSVVADMRDLIERWKFMLPGQVITVYF